MGLLRLIHIGKLGGVIDVRARHQTVIVGKTVGRVIDDHMRSAGRNELSPRATSLYRVLIDAHRLV